MNRKISPFLETVDLVTLIHATLILRLDYCNMLYKSQHLEMTPNLQLDQIEAVLLNCVNQTIHLITLSKHVIQATHEYDDNRPFELFGIL